MKRTAPTLAGPRVSSCQPPPRRRRRTSSWFQNGFDPYGSYQYPGNLGVSVDRHNAERTAVTYGSPAESTAQTIHNDYNFTVHAGWLVGPWWRLMWAVLGLVPLLLAVTGLSTWLYKRGVRKQRRRAAAVAALATPETPM